MKNIHNNQFLLMFKNASYWAFALPFAYWTYLFFTTTMLVESDAFWYDKLSLDIYQKGLPGFFQNNPHSVALYPLIISFSRHMADFLSVSYLKVQTGIQIFILFISQLLLYKLLICLKIKRNIIIAIVFYFGISPAIVNSAFSLFSEIVTYPLVLALLLIFVSAWQSVLKNQTRKVLIFSVLLSILFLFLVLVRPVYEYILVLFLLLLLTFSVIFLIRKQRKQFINILLLVLTAFPLFQLALIPYRQMNYKFNGHTSLVNSGSLNLYGNTVVRTGKLTSKDIMIYLSMIPGNNVCQKIFSSEECSGWLEDCRNVSLIKRKELQDQGISNNQIDAALYKLSLKNILGNPFQYAFLTAAEAPKMLFWESTQVGFVIYLPWLSKVFDFVPLKNGLRLFVFLITIFSLLYVVQYLFKNKKELFDINHPNNTTTLFLFFIIALILINIALHSPFVIVVRYGLPLAPLYLLAIAFTLQKLFCKN